MGKILLLEDEDLFRTLVKKVLTDEKHDVTALGSAVRAIDLAREKCFDLLITDLIMPDKEGIETIMEFRELAPATKIIAMSGGGKESPDSYLYFAEKLGAAKTLSKPFSRQELIDTVNTVLSGCQ